MTLNKYRNLKHEIEKMKKSRNDEKMKNTKLNNDNNNEYKNGNNNDNNNSNNRILAL